MQDIAVNNGSVCLGHIKRNILAKYSEWYNTHPHRNTNIALDITDFCIDGVMFAEKPYYYQHGNDHINWTKVIDILNYPWDMNKISGWNYNLVNTQVACIIMYYLRMYKRHDILLQYIQMMCE